MFISWILNYWFWLPFPLSCKEANEFLKKCPFSLSSTHNETILSSSFLQFYLCTWTTVIFPEGPCSYFEDRVKEFHKGEFAFINVYQRSSKGLQASLGHGSGQEILWPLSLKARVRKFKLYKYTRIGRWHSKIMCKKYCPNRQVGSINGYTNTSHRENAGMEPDIHPAMDSTPILSLKSHFSTGRDVLQLFPFYREEDWGIEHLHFASAPSCMRLSHNQTRWWISEPPAAYRVGTLEGTITPKCPSRFGTLPSCPILCRSWGLRLEERAAQLSRKILEMLTV